MSWEDRPYHRDPYEPSYGGAGGGLRSWFGGLPPAGKATKYILIANIAMFVLCLLTGRDGSPVYQWLAMQTDAVKEGQIWRLVTFTYLHDPDSIMHILFNMLGLYLLGAPLERHWGSKRFFVFYTVGGAAAVTLYLLLTLIKWLSPAAFLVGASGNVLAVLGACAVLFPGFRIILLFFPVPIRTAVALLVVLWSFNLFTRGGNAGGDACHLAGLAFGIYWAYRGHRVMDRIEHMKVEAKRGVWQKERERQQALQDRVDRILEKVHRDGMNSLSRQEKKILEDASRRQAEADRKWGV